MPRNIKLPTIYASDIQKIKWIYRRRYFYIIAARNLAIIATLINTGIKTSVLTSLDKVDYNKENKVILLKHPKAPRKIILNKQTNDLIIYYLSFRKDRFRPLFIRELKRSFINLKRDLRLSSRAIQRIVKDFVIKNDLNKNFTPTAFRHIAGLNYARQGASHAMLEKKLGHVAPWVKTDYIKAGKIALNTNKLFTPPKPYKLVCKLHKKRLKLLITTNKGRFFGCHIENCIEYFFQEYIEMN